MRKEIGSEFWSTDSIKSSDLYNRADSVCLLSGMTALDYIISDIRKKHNLDKVLLPSYCCESMILPFLNRNVAVEFYSVEPEKICYDFSNTAQAILLIDFFGYATPEMENIASEEKKNGKIIIYDSTHHIDGNASLQCYADYSFISYRKWCFANFAIASKHTGDFFVQAPMRHHPKYVHLREQASKEKRLYIESGIGDKQSYLSLFAQAEEVLDHDYAGYAGVPSKIDFKDIKEKRRANAAYLVSELKKIPQVELWHNVLGPNDVPLFVPILVASEYRGKLRAFLIQHDIYCPIHWLYSDVHGMQSRLFSQELSLVCDQRYDLQDMERMIECIRRFFVTC